MARPKQKRAGCITWILRGLIVFFTLGLFGAILQSLGVVKPSSSDGVGSPINIVTAVPQPTQTFTLMPVLVNTDSLPIEKVIVIPAFGVTNTPVAVVGVKENPTVIPTNSPVPIIPSATQIIPSATFLPTRTPVPILPTATIPPPVVAQTTTYYILGSANIRACPQLDCTILSSFGTGEAMEVEAFEDGASFDGSTRWARFRRNGQVMYVHSALISTNKPLPTQAPVIQEPPPVQNQPAVQQPAVQQPEANSPQQSVCGSCPTCGALSTCEEAKHWFFNCGCTRLDGNEDDVPCERLCN